MSHTVFPRCRLLVAVAVVLLFAGPAAAQDPDDRHISVGAAAGIATPFHADFEFTAISWQADVRVDTARDFGFSVFIEEWRHTDDVTRTIGWSLLGKNTMGRATITGGGGVSYFLYTRNQFNSSSFAAQLQAGVDVLVAPHTSVMGQFRLVVPVQDPRVSYASYVGGARFVF